MGIADQRDREMLVSGVARDRHRLASRLAQQSDDLGRVLFLCRQVVQHDIRALAGKRDRDARAD